MALTALNSNPAFIVVDLQEIIDLLLTRRA